MLATPIKAPYDPAKVIEAMFNGSVTRIGHALKDPTNYSRGTKFVLAECAKRFQDALDDCEIQLLDAKWYLEHLLAQNRARREEQERQKESASAALKRKHEEAQEIGEAMDIDSPAKRKKSDSDELENKAEKEVKVKLSTTDTEVDKPTESVSSQPQTQTEEKTEKELPKPDSDKPAAEKPVEPVKPPEINTEAVPTNTDDFMNLKATPNDTPAATNDEFNFESMFEPDGNDPTNDDMNIDLDLGDTFTNEPTNNAQEMAALTSLMPGLESFTNQNGDDLNLNDGNGNQLPSFSGNFDLPDLGGTNSFDDFLNDDGLGGGDFGGASNFEGDVDLSEEALNNLSFDEMFGDSL